MIVRFIHRLVERWDRIVVPDMPVDDRTLSSNLVLHLPDPCEEPWIGEEDDDVWSLFLQASTKLILRSMTIDRLDDPTIVSVELRRDDLGPVVRMLDSSSQTEEAELLRPKETFYDITSLDPYT